MENSLTIGAVIDAPTRLALACDDGDFSYEALDRERRRLAEAFRLAGTRQALLYAEPTFTAYASLLALASLGTPIILVPADPSAAVSRQVDEVIGTDTVIRGGVVAPTTSGIVAGQVLEPGSVVIITSGTTGTPKVVRHSWSTLAHAVRVRLELRGSIWFLAYPYHLYAGLQVVLHVLLNGGTTVMLPADREVEATVRRIADKAVEYISGTPSFFRRLLLFASRPALARVRLSQITLGGERVTQDVLDALRDAFPSTRIVHIYATSELGRCFSVEDGREGFPAELLTTGTKDGVRLRVRQGELEVQPVNAMNGYLHDAAQPWEESGWVMTGDLVEIVEDRAYFRGRRHDLINVGGSKVNPTAVEDVIRSCPHVVDVRVFGRRSALVGELVSAEVVGDDGLDEASLRAAILEHCAARLSEVERPRIVRFVPRMAVSEAGKIIRRTEGQ